MGSAVSSADVSKTIYVQHDGKIETIVFGRYCNAHDIVEMLAQTARVSSASCLLSLESSEGSKMCISGTMPTNTASNPYRLIITKDKVPTNGKLNSNGATELHEVFKQVADQFNKALKAEESKHDLEKRLNILEKRLDGEGLKLIEIERCKKDISEIKDSLITAHKKMVDYNRLSALSDDGKIALRRDVPSYPKYTLSQETIDYLKTPTFDIWHWESNEMLSLLEHMYHELDLVNEFSINPVTLKRWLLCVQENYRNNPFHNFRHCFCVAQMMYGMINLCGLNTTMSREDLGILITAAICHDLDHPGYNNTYQINARTDLAIRYNDISPLENHHCAVTFQILNNPETNIFSNIDQVTFKRIRSGIIMLILATDMARHKEILDTFKAKVSEGFDLTHDDAVSSLKMVLIKCCDISNEVRPFEVSEPWVDCLLEEYFNQSDREKEEGLPVAPFMDREKVTKPTAQIGFIKFVLIPMFESVAKVFEQLEPAMVIPLRGSLERYEEMKEGKSQ